MSSYTNYSMMDKYELRIKLEQDGLFRSDGGLNTAWIHNRAKNYDFSALDGDTLQEKLYLLYHDRSYCRICGKPNKFINWNSGYTTVCSRECKREFDRQTLREKAVPKVRSAETVEKRKRTCIEKYGVDNPFKSKAVQEKIKETNIKNLGVVHPAQNKSVVEKMEATNKSRHGGVWNSQTPEHIARTKQHFRKLIDDFEKKNNCTQIEKIISEYGQGFYQLGLPKIQYGRYKFISNEYLEAIKKHYQETLAHKTHAEQEIYEYCRTLLGNRVTIECNTRQIIKNEEGKCLELDLYIPEKRLAIEYNGIYYHSSKDKNYHLTKTEACESKGIRLLHIWEDLWTSKKEIYKSIIASALGVYREKVYARKCTCREISQSDYENFLNKNHIQGAVQSKIRLGLFYNGELIQVAGWGRSRFKDSEYELHRMCSKINTQVIGGFSKLIKHSGINQFKSYVDRDLYTGSGYLASGFKIIGKTGPGYFYSNSKLQRVNRLSAQKHKLKSLLTNFDEELTEVENMQNNGYYRLWNCGNCITEYKENQLSS